jgi:membrane protein DedA with SNARE-associated domain
MPDLSVLVDHWGYPAIFLVVTLGNLGLPVPEETILALAGYLVWEGKLRLPPVILVGVLSAATGDALGYWVGRRYGRGAVERYGSRVFLSPERMRSIRGFVTRYGAFGVFAARFVPGLRALAGPLAGAAGLPVLRFATGNLLGAVCYVPYAVGIGYAAGYGLGSYADRIGLVGRAEHVVLIAAGIGAVAVLGWRALRMARARREI